MLWVIAYDIADDGRRRKVFDRLGVWGVAVQYSVFECRLSATNRKVLAKEIAALINADEDSVAWFPICRHDVSSIVRAGRDEAWHVEEGFFAV